MSRQLKTSQASNIYINPQDSNYPVYLPLIPKLFRDLTGRNIKFSIWQWKFEFTNVIKGRRLKSHVRGEFADWLKLMNIK